MQTTLYALIELQEIDNRLDELKEERGDLPLIVEELQEKLSSKTEELQKQREQVKQSKLRQRELELFLDEAREKLAKYEEQLYQVKTNKEYDAITAETDTVKAQLEESENELLGISDTIGEIKGSIETLESEISKLESELDENRTDLEQAMNATAEEENLLLQERKIITEKSSPEIIKTYEMVREARGGQGIARVVNGVCGGCFSYIPPQKVVEIKKMKKIYICEFCGRILVWDESNQ